METIDKSNKKGYNRQRNVFFLENLLYRKNSFEKHIGSFKVNLLKHRQSTPHKGQTGEAMRSNLFTAPWGRLIGTLFALIFLAFGLAACGGGGGSSTTANSPPSGTLAGTTGCVIPQDGVSCNPTITWVTTNATDTKVKLGAVTVSSAASGTNTTQVVGAGISTVDLYNGSDKLATVAVEAVCAPGTTLTGNTCTLKKVPTASVTILAASSGLIPQVVHVYADGTHETLTPAVKTGAIGNCVIRREPQKLSQPINCSDALGVRSNLSWDKVAMTITAYDGSSGTLPAWTDTVGETSYWLDVSTPDFSNNSAMVFKYPAATGVFYVDGTNPSSVFFRPSNGSPDFNASGKVGSIKAITGF